MAETDVAQPAAVNGFTTPSQDSAVLDSDSLVEYLINLLNVTLGASIAALQADESLFSNSKRDETIERCNRYLTSTAIAIYAQKHSRFPFASDQVNGTNRGRLGDCTS